MIDVIFILACLLIQEDISSLKNDHYLVGIPDVNVGILDDLFMLPFLIL